MSDADFLVLYEGDSHRPRRWVSVPVWFNHPLTVVALVPSVAGRPTQ